jgi:hypothetical protein
MQTKEVVIGSVVVCRIGAELARVVVVAQATKYNGRTGFRVRRENEREALPKLRSAAALRAA